MKKSMSKLISFLLIVVIVFGLTACNSENEKDEDFISKEEKYGIISEGMLGANGSLVKEYSGYLGYGYNVITSAFYNHKDIKTGHPIIDMDKLALEQDKVYIDRKHSRHVDVMTFISGSAKEYSEHFATSANVKARIGFAGSIKASFNMDHTAQMTSMQKLITTQALIETQNDYILDVDAKLVAKYVSDAFKTAVSEKSAKELVDIYGTHVLVNISMGGRFDLNYLYTRTENSESTDILVSAQASYYHVSGNTSTQIAKDKKEIETNSRLLVKTYGGGVSSDLTTIESAKASYTEWAKGVEDGHVTFVSASEVIPIWEVVPYIEGLDNASYKSKAIQNYFDSEVDRISGDFKNTINTPIYISEIHIGYGSSQTDAKNMLRGKGITEGNILPLDLNAGAGGYWIYLGYKTTTDKSLAITGLIADDFKSKQSSSKTQTHEGVKYSIIDSDLNKGARGRYIYLFYTRDPKAGDPVSVIQYQQNEDFQYSNVKADGFSPVGPYGKYTALDLNKGAGGDFIYLWFRRG